MTADLIIENARILTMDPSLPRAEAIAVKDGEILAIGERSVILGLRSSATEMIDAHGATVLPGFIESHMHLFFGAMTLRALDLTGVRGLDELRQKIIAHARANPDDVLVRGFGVDHEILPCKERITRHHLDSIISDRPFAMQASEGHTMWANTRALEAAGLLHGMEVPPGCEIVMGEDGLAGGELRESEAFSPLLELGGELRLSLALTTGGEPEEPTSAERAADRAIAKRGLDYCASHGITSFHNMDGNLYELELLSEIEAEGGLNVRAQIPFHYKNFMTPDALEKASMMAERYNSEWLSSGMVKAFMDGVLDSWTAFMDEPYADRPDWCGEPLFTQEHFNALAAEADRRGLQIAVHACGDGSVRSILDGFEHARRANGPRDSRHRIEHVEVIRPADIDRLVGLGVIAAMQPPHPPGSMNLPLEPTLSRVGRARWPYGWASRTLREAGARIPFASDWPISPISPILGIQAAVRRKPFGPGMPDQSCSLMEALAAYTVEGAYAEFMEHRKGQLKCGYLADIVVLSDDIEEVHIDDLDTMEPVVTICGGKITYRKG